MKKFISLFISCLLLCVCFATVAVAEESSADVYVSIANKGVLAVSYEKVTVTDIDDDGKLTVNDTLFAIHEAKYEGGAKAGYSYYSTEQYGLSIGTLWGDTSGCFGYYINNASAWSLSDEVKSGDYVYGFVYTDSENWSDSYTFFDKSTVSVESGNEITLTLKKSSFDSDWNPITLPSENAVITVDGTATEIKTDANGNATIKIDEAGSYIISAKSDSEIIVPPVCILSVKESEISTDSIVESNTESEIPKAGDDSFNITFIVIAILSVATVLTISCKTRRNEF